MSSFNVCFKKASTLAQSVYQEINYSFWEMDFYTGFDWMWIITYSVISLRDSMILPDEIYILIKALCVTQEND